PREDSNLPLRDCDFGDTGLEVDIEARADRNCPGVACRHSKAPSNIMHNLKEGLSAVELDYAFRPGISHGCFGVSIETQHRAIGEPLDALLTLRRSIGLRNAEKLSVVTPTEGRRNGPAPGGRKG